jgi:hypothetical protein
LLPLWAALQALLGLQTIPLLHWISNPLLTRLLSQLKKDLAGYAS